MGKCGAAAFSYVELSDKVKDMDVKNKIVGRLSHVLYFNQGF